MTLRKACLYQDDDDDDDEIVDAEPEDVAAEIAGLEGDAEIPIEELRKRMAAFEEEERKAKASIEAAFGGFGRLARGSPLGIRVRPPQVLDTNLLAVEELVPLSRLDHGPPHIEKDVRLRFWC